MRILIATTVARTVNAFLVPQVAALGSTHSVTVVCADPGVLDERVRRVAETASAPWSRRPGPSDVVRGVRNVRRMLARSPFDVVYVHTSVASGIVRLSLLGRRRRPAVVYCAHGLAGAAVRPWPVRTAARLVERVLGAVTDTIIVMNDEDEEWAHSLRSTRVVRVPSVGLDVASWTRDVGGSDDPTRRRVVVIAELIPRKRVDLAIETVGRLDDDHVLSIAGDGPLLQELESTASALGLADRVEFLGQVDDVRSLLSSASVLLCTSRQEGLARSVLEALALGVPVVAADARGVTDALSRGGGVVVGDRADELAAAVRRVTGDQELRQRLSDEGRRAVRDHDLPVVTPLFVEAVESAGRSRRVGSET